MTNTKGRNVETIMQKITRAARWRGAAAACVALALMTASAATQDAIQAKRSAILAYVRDLQKHKQTLIGVQVNEYEVYLDCTSVDRIFEQTGARPAIMGLELMNAIAFPPYAAYLTDRALSQTAAGGLVTMSWHERNPVAVCPRGEFFECAKKPMTADTLGAVLTKGTPENRLWLADVDAVAKVLDKLRKRGIVVLFRPYHEMNGGWFWWGKQDAYPELWDALYDELVVRDKLDNLIWVWSSDRDTPDSKRYFPLRHKPDIVGIDVYENDPDSPKYAAGRANVTTLGGSAPFALTEVGIIPSRKVLDDLNPAWVLLWGGEFLNADWAWDNKCSGCNKPERVSALFKLDRTLALAQVPATLRATLAAGVVNKHPLHRKNPSCPAKLH
jgi:mannan endo-1,4-beta-mannosidase